MSERTIGKTSDARIIYSDIIDMPHHQSKTHPHMSLYDRAAQFAPFAALTGYEDMVNEEARITDSEISIEDSVRDVISQKLNLISEAIKNGVYPSVSITYFVPDASKDGGKYITVNERIKKIDSVGNQIILIKTKGTGKVNETISFADITDITGDLVDYLQY
ncbi:hypothetical protein [Pseudobutyrivibrio xylanivorans]|uniref:YolD-like family protein n=1 Tax=Pseudobutyrivibrio xylanivorans TaxID=185007 RepID=A0A1G5S5Q2_PSEXY|nr:hypothetical protein [Pseudobutyrivibrio xylanivorans]SCZ81656.1 hypothetical protein SAMN02910350_02924 [Pseudobutyrivibrio xylanivorans]